MVDSREPARTETNMAIMLPTTSFKCSKLNSTTWLLVEDDIYRETPFIYAKIHPTEPILILTDTGCDAPRSKGHDFDSLKRYLEEYPVPANAGKPLNPRTRIDGMSGERVPARDYIVIISHW